MPIPPIQCVKLLQNKIDRGNISTSVNIEAPVVEKPETDSNNALINEEVVPDSEYGRAPVTTRIIHEIVTVK